MSLLKWQFRYLEGILFQQKKTVAPMVAPGRGLEHAAGWAAHAAVSGEAAAGAAKDSLALRVVTSNAF